MNIKCVPGKKPWEIKATGMIINTFIKNVANTISTISGTPLPPKGEEWV